MVTPQVHSAMSSKISHPGSLYTPQKAEEIAAQMNESDDWTYVVKHDPTGRGLSFIQIFDEDGIFIGKL